MADSLPNPLDVPELPEDTMSEEEHDRALPMVPEDSSEEDAEKRDDDEMDSERNS